MKNERLSIQRVVIYVLIAILFSANLILYITLSVSFVNRSIENEIQNTCRLFAGELLADASSKAALAGKSLPESFDDHFQEIAKELEDMDVWLTDETGRVLCFRTDSGEAAEPAILAKDAQGLLEGIGSGEILLSWSGHDVFLMKGDQCFAAGALVPGRYYLVMADHFTGLKARLRQQLALMIAADLIMVLILCVLLVNSSAAYRRRLAKMATIDELTGLANRKFFNAQYGELLLDESRKEYSLFLLDVDHFKQINDVYGHAAGDAALKVLAEKIRLLMERCGGFAGRWGGDEFIGVLPMKEEQALRELRKLSFEIASEKISDAFSMSISVGVAGAAPSGERRLEKLSEMADSCLYQSKENGRNTVTGYASVGPKQAAGEQSAAPAETIRKQIDEAEAVSIPQEEPGAESEKQTGEGRGFGGRLSDFLRNRLIKSVILGVRWMTPFVAGGGILIALAFLFDAASVDLSALSLEERAAFGSITPLAALLKEIGQTTFNFMLPVFAGFMAYGLAGEDALMAGFVGGYMTINSNSGFAGAMIAGFAAGLLTAEFHDFSRHLPKVLRKAAPIVIYPVINLLLMAGLSRLVISPIASAVGVFFNGLLDRALSASRVGGSAFAAMMMATDMGGMINKVAYQYGLDSIVANETGIMAAVMIGGMVPPIGIAISLLAFKNRYSRRERERSHVTLFMGLAFITEGALPFVFTDIARVIPSCMAGSLLAGALCAFFGCRLPAPHGGIFVVPLIEHPFCYLLSLLAGSLLTAMLLGFLKKDCSIGDSA